MKILLKLSILALALTFAAASSGRERRFIADTITSIFKFKLKDRDGVLKAAGDLVHLGQEIGGQIDWIKETEESYRAKATDDDQDPRNVIADFMSNLYTYMKMVGENAISYSTTLIDAVNRDGSELFDVFDAAVRYPMGSVWQAQYNMQDVEVWLQAVRDAEPSEATDAEETLTKLADLKAVLNQVIGKYAELTKAGIDQ